MKQARGVAVFALLAVLAQSFLTAPADALGVGAPVRFVGARPHVSVKRHSGKSVKRHNIKAMRPKNASSKWRAKKARRPAKPVPLPQSLIPLLSSKTMAPGVVYKRYHGALSINVIDADLLQGQLQARPVLAGSSFNMLSEVKHHARQSNAIAAVNANYFKKDGTPLGTLIIDKEWISGPLYDRVSMGITASGYVKIDRVNLAGTLQTSNPVVPSIWVNNINQPRRTGSRLIVYTQRWGRNVRMAYPGTLVAVDSQGRVISISEQVMDIPWGGYVLSDSKVSPIANLNPGDTVSLSWQTRPDNWGDVVQAVSGGPMLMKNGKLYLDLEDERFKSSWTSSSIHARTAVGVTADNHLLLVTIEGPHTLWDMAKFLQKLGAVDAMNLDGGGSTTMVVNGITVTRNGNSYQRRVASALAIVAAARNPAPVAMPPVAPTFHIDPIDAGSSTNSTPPEITPTVPQPDGQAADGKDVSLAAPMASIQQANNRN